MNSRMSDLRHCSSVVKTTGLKNRAGRNRTIVEVSHLCSDRSTNYQESRRGLGERAVLDPAMSPDEPVASLEQKESEFGETRLGRNQRRSARSARRNANLGRISQSHPPQKRLATSPEMLARNHDTLAGKILLTSTSTTGTIPRTSRFCRREPWY